MKRIISLTLVLFMIVPLLLVVPMTASAATGADIVAEAEKWRQANSPYGHSDGSGGYGTSVDCSGLVLQVYKKFGYNLEWSATAQSQAGIYVDKSSLQPGDIVCFSYSDGSIGHVGIYVGNDKMIHAPGVGRYVQYGNYISSWTYDDGCKLEYGRRIINGTHTHSFWIEYESAHPHREYRRCSCGHTEYTGYIPNGFELKNETEHPHREYKKCYNCDYTEYTGNTVTVSTCNQCITPGKPSLLNFNYIHAADRDVEFSWNSTVNTTHYNLYIGKKNSDGEYETYQNTFYAESGMTLSLPLGEYQVFLQSTNSNARTDDGSTWRFTNSDVYYFIVTDQSPIFKEISGPSDVVPIGTNFKFTFEVSMAEEASLTIKSPSQKKTQYDINGTTTFNHTFNEVGYHTIDYNVKSAVGGFGASSRVYVAEYGGSCGENAYWAIDEEGTLHVTGTGEMTTEAADDKWDDYCEKVNAIEIEDGITSIANGAFALYENVISVNIPGSVKTIGSDAFYGCKNLKTLRIPEGVETIGSGAIRGCDELISVSIPSTVIEMNFSSHNFLYCNSLTDITIAQGNENYTSVNGVVFNKDYTKLLRYLSAKTDSTYTIPNTVTEIGEQAFVACSGLIEVTIPDSVTSIGNYAFSGCSGLTDVRYTGTQEQWNELIDGVVGLGLDNTTIHYGSNSSVAVTAISLDKKNLILTAGTSETLTATVSPSNATNKNVAWSSSDESVATISNGVVTAVSAGTAIITAETEDGGYTATCAVTVTAPVEDVKATFTLSDVSGKPGDTVKVKLSLKTDEAINSIAISNINYDASLLSFVGFSDYEHIEDLTVLPPTFDADKTAIVIGLKKAATFDGDICTLIFKIKDGVDEGSANIIATSLVKNSSTVIASYVEQGSVTVHLQLLGDVDGNDTVDIDDAVALFQYSMLPELYPINYVGNVDFDKSGTVDIDDAVLLFQYSMLPDLYPIE